VTRGVVWLASYPKSGNTWLRAVYTALRSGREPDINRLEAPLPALRAVFDQVLAVRSSDLSPDEVGILRPRAIEAPRPGQDAWWKVHDALVKTPAGEHIVPVEATRAAIYIVRDPRDIALSWARHADVPPAEAVKWMCAPGACLASSLRRLEDQVPQPLGTWSEHVRSWTEEPPFPVYVLRYEDCLADPVGRFYAAFHFGGLKATVDEVAQAVSVASFERLRAQEATKGFRERQSANNPFFQSGTFGRWREQLPPHLVQQLADVHGEIMTRFGYRP